MPATPQTHPTEPSTQARFPTPIGFIGVGELAAALVDGLCSLPGPGFEVLLSPRGAATAAPLADPVVEQIFEGLGGTLRVNDDRTFDALASATGTCSTLLGLVSAIVRWLSRQGVDARTADEYVRQMVHGVVAPLRDSRHSMSALVEAHETPGGLNEQLRTRWLDESNLSALHRGLDLLNARIAGTPSREE